MAKIPLQSQKAIKVVLRKPWDNCLPKKPHHHDTCNIRPSSRMETTCLVNLLFFSNVYSGHVCSFTVTNFNKLFLTFSRVEQAGDFPTDFPAMPQFSWEETGANEPPAVPAHSHILHPSAWRPLWSDRLWWYLQAVGKAEAQVVENAVAVITLSLQGAKVTSWPARLR